MEYLVGFKQEVFSAVLKNVMNISGISMFR